MSKSIFVLSAFFVFLPGFSVFAAELLVGDEQSFETGVAPGRWQLFTWPATSSDAQKAPSPLSDGQDVTGADIDLATSATAAPGWGGSSLHLMNFEDTGDNDTGGVYIQLEVVSGATYTISANFYGLDRGGYHYAFGFSVDTDGQSTDPLDVDYGYGRTGGVNSEFDSNRVDPGYDVGEWMWNEPGSGSQELQWFGPDQIKLEIQATGEMMTIYLWGLSKGSNLDALVDGVSVDGPNPLTATPTPPSANKVWEAYR